MLAVKLSLVLVLKLFILLSISIAKVIFQRTFWLSANLHFYKRIHLYSKTQACRENPMNFWLRFANEKRNRISRHKTLAYINCLVLWLHMGGIVITCSHCGEEKKNELPLCNGLWKLKLSNFAITAMATPPSKVI